MWLFPQGPPFPPSGAVLCSLEVMCAVTNGSDEKEVGSSLRLGAQGTLTRRGEVCLDRGSRGRTASVCPGLGLGLAGDHHSSTFSPPFCWTVSRGKNRLLV